MYTIPYKVITLTRAQKILPFSSATRTESSNFLRTFDRISILFHENEPETAYKIVVAVQDDPALRGTLGGNFSLVRVVVSFECVKKILIVEAVGEDVVIKLNDIWKELGL